MKSHRINGVALRASTIVLVMTAGASAGGSNYVWQRAADWVPGNTAGGTVNNPGPGAGGSTIWQYEYTQGGALGAGNAWYKQPTSLMSWDPEWWDTGWGVWSRGDNTSPPVMAGRLVHNVHTSSFNDVPVVRWNSPFGVLSDLNINGTLLVNWNGMGGVGRPVDVDVVIAKQNAQRTITTMLFSTTVSKPNPFASVGDTVNVPVDLSGISLDTGESIIISHRGRNSMYPTGAWVNMYDNITFSAIPAPGSLGLLGIAALAMTRRRRN